MHLRLKQPGFYHQLRQQLGEQLLTHAFDLGRYSTDASIYQVFPQAVVLPKNWQQVEQTLSIADRHNSSVTARGAGTSQAGQTANTGVIIDCKKHLNKIIDFDHVNALITVQPGMVLDELNHFLKPHGLWFAIDISTSSRATIGGMAANNAAGSRSLKYGMMRQQVHSYEWMYADGHIENIIANSLPSRLQKLSRLVNTQAEQILQQRPKVQRNVAGYNLDALVHRANQPSAYQEFFIGSEGTLGLFKSITLKLSPLLQGQVLAVVHFQRLSKAMNAVQHLLALQPNAIELMDHNLLSLAQTNTSFKTVLQQFVQGNPQAILLVEFSGDQLQIQQKLQQCEDIIASLGIHWQHKGQQWGGVKRITNPLLQNRIWQLRKHGLNIMMSMKTAQKPIAFIEDCAVPVQHLAAYTQGLTDIFKAHQTTGVFYGHAAVGTLHVRPVINLKQQLGLRQMQQIMQQATDLVKQFNGSHSGEHGDGIVRAYFHKKMLPTTEFKLMQQAKKLLDPNNRLNPNRLVNPPHFADAKLLRYPPNYQASKITEHFNWQEWQTTDMASPQIKQGMQAAVEMCNSNGACLKKRGGHMCPSYRASENEADSVRGRATSLRLALSGQLGGEALNSSAMAKTLQHCVSCKACQSECPMGVDMAKLKAEVMAQQRLHSKLTWQQRLQHKLVGQLPFYAPKLHAVAKLINAANNAKTLRQLNQLLTGFSADRQLPNWATTSYLASSKKPLQAVTDKRKQVFLFADTFNNHFEVDNLLAAEKLLTALGFTVVNYLVKQPLCCGRTLIATGQLAQAKQQLQHTTRQFKQLISQGISVVGLEPSCIFSFRDEALSLLSDWTMEQAKHIFYIDEFLQQLATPEQQRLQAILAKLPKRDYHLHSHCHQKAAKATEATVALLQQIPNSRLTHIDSGCCGMAGQYGFLQENQSMSRNMAELVLLPHIRQLNPQTTQLLATGSSCRYQIQHLSDNQPLHPIRLINQALT